MQYFILRDNLQVKLVLKILSTTLSPIQNLHFYLDFCLHNDCEKFIYASSMSVYGLHNKENVKETLKCDPKSFYAVGKLASENYMKIYSSSGIQTTALRLFNTYGPGQNMSNMNKE